MTDAQPVVYFRPQENWKLLDGDGTPLSTITINPSRERRGLFGRPVDDLAAPLTRGRRHAEKYTQSLAAILLPFFWEFQNYYHSTEGGGVAACLPSSRSTFQCPSRYRANRIGFTPWVTVLWWLQSQGFLVKVAGGCKGKEHFQGLTAAYKQTAQLQEWFRDHYEALGPDHLDTRYEPIHLKDREKVLIDYVDNEHTEGLRKQIDSINEAIRNHSFEIPIGKGYARVHSSELELTRNFREDFQSGGRLSCPLQRLSKKDRGLLRINGKGVVELDYKSHQARMLYHLNGKTPPLDCYEHPSIPRPLMKEATIRVMNCKSELQTLGALRKLLRDEPETDDLPTGPELLEAVWESHPLIRQTMEDPLWEKLHYLESSIAVNIMEKLTAKGKPCLGIHDSFVVEENDRDLLRALMVDEYRKVMGGHYPVVSEA
ncbi:hypothetical protein Q9252_10205 [Marinobacter salarius]|uniref:hypothetical protein n=1 Tax=Marinobacter salarius TaxID=1420917 RepID=UPI00273BBAB6|nr:hypothetical protein [Marinobacter salarius]MDP4532515.1 hypothetical protein [Marinobacter salarius]